MTMAERGEQLWFAFAYDIQCRGRENAIRIIYAERIVFDGERYPFEL